MDKKKPGFPFFIFISIGVVLIGMLLLHLNGDIAVLNPKGLIALKQRNLIISVTAMMLIIVIPVFILTFLFVWKYREGNIKAKYAPDWDHDRKIELAWWSLPCAIILGVALLAWKATHELDPFKPITASKKPLKIQVVALQWKWLFLYPEERIASINFVHFPHQTPIDFEITADAPMNSFWIPQLGGQIYAMPGMRTELHLIANETGNFRGSSANISGEGFAGMTFIAKASSEEDFAHWVQTSQRSTNSLDQAEYDQLVKPSSYNPVISYSLADRDLYERIVTKYIEK